MRRKLRKLLNIAVIFFLFSLLFIDNELLIYPLEDEDWKIVPLLEARGDGIVSLLKARFTEM